MGLLNLVILVLLILTLWSGRIETPPKTTETQSSEYDYADDIPAIYPDKEDERKSVSCQSNDPDCGTDDDSDEESEMAEFETEDCDNSTAGNDHSKEGISRAESIMIAFIGAFIVSLAIYLALRNNFRRGLHPDNFEIPSDPEILMDSVEEPLHGVPRSMLQGPTRGLPNTNWLEMDPITWELRFSTETED